MTDHPPQGSFEREDETTRTLRLLHEDVSQLRTYLGVLVLLVAVCAVVVALIGFGAIDVSVKPAGL